MNKTELIAVLEICISALEDLGACNDKECTEENCLHALPIAIETLSRLRGGADEE